MTYAELYKKWLVFLMLVQMDAVLPVKLTCNNNIFVITIYCKIIANGTLHLRDDNISALSWINKETDPN